jgi:hypothetical protein
VALVQTWAVAGRDESTRHRLPGRRRDFIFIESHSGCVVSAVGKTNSLFELYRRPIQ